MGVKPRIFIDGSAGTTGLRIRERLADRGDLELLTVPEELRKDPSARAEQLNGADVVFLCLPDEAARESVGLIRNPRTVVIDTSTAHRTAPGWTYGFAELTGQRERIAASRRIANPGCHAGGFIALAAPLTEAGILSPDADLYCFSLTGYSGGGKKMIAAYEDPAAGDALKAPRMYGLSQAHKHLPEMQAVCGLTRPPIFCPVVGDFYAGMEVTVPLFRHTVKGGPEEIAEIYKARYPGPVIRFTEKADEEGFLSAGRLAGSDGMEISVQGNGERILLTARFDNLGKGASGSAIQNMNLVLGLPETAGLAL